jgi:type IX secretion system PorP/SprF family membrane protein
MNKIYLVLLCSVMLKLTGLQAQDPHFSQYYASPLILNPATTGFFEGKYRVNTLYRNQWPGVYQNNAYKTIYAGIDMNFKLNRKNDAMSGGLMFYNDRAGIGNFATTGINLSFAYKKVLDYYGKNQLSIGFQAGLIQRNLTYDNYTFEDQFDGVGYNTGTLEDLPGNSFAFGDYSTGLYWSYKFNKQSSMHAGLGLAHISQPNMTFFRDDADTIVNRLPMKINFQTGLRFPLGGDRSRLAMLPKLMLSMQGKALELNAGSNFRIQLDQFGFAALHLGAWARPVRDVEGSMALDAIVMLAGLEYQGLMIGFSYDLNTVDLSNTRGQRTAFEISVSYIGEYEDEAIICPTF